jgi:hypothetical protein
MNKGKSAEPTNPPGLFTTNDQGIKEVQAGSMSLIVGNSSGLVGQFEEETVEEYSYPELPDGISDEYDAWLG